MAENNNAAALALLNEALRLEYSIIIHFPRMVNMVRDARLKKYISVLGNDSVGHADAVAAAIRQMGGNPNWSFEAPPDGQDMRQIMETQLEKEHQAEKLHRKVGDLMLDPELRQRFYGMSEDEKHHAELAKKILEMLN
jgi:bacterioferritin